MQERSISGKPGRTGTGADALVLLVEIQSILKDILSLSPTVAAEYHRELDGRIVTRTPRAQGNLKSTLCIRKVRTVCTLTTKLGNIPS